MYVVTARLARTHDDVAAGFQPRLALTLGLGDDDLVRRAWVVDRPPNIVITALLGFGAFERERVGDVQCVLGW